MYLQRLSLPVFKLTEIVLILIAVIIPMMRLTIVKITVVFMVIATFNFKLLDKNADSSENVSLFHFSSAELRIVKYYTILILFSVKHQLVFHIHPYKCISTCQA